MKKSVPLESVIRRLKDCLAKNPDATVDLDQNSQVTVYIDENSKKIKPFLEGDISDKKEDLDIYIATEYDVSFLDSFEEGDIVFADYHILYDEEEKHKMDGSEWNGEVTREGSCDIFVAEGIPENVLEAFKRLARKYYVVDETVDINFLGNTFSVKSWLVGHHSKIEVRMKERNFNTA